MDTVFRSVRKIYNSTLIQISLVILLYVIYVFCVFSLSDNLLGEICYEYSLPLFISTYFFRTYGKYLILLTPILLQLIVKISHIEITATFPQLLMMSGIIFCLFLFVEWGNPQYKNLKFLPIFILSMLLGQKLHIESFEPLL